MYSIFGYVYGFGFIVILIVLTMFVIFQGKRVGDSPELNKIDLAKSMIGIPIVSALWPIVISVAVFMIVKDIIQIRGGPDDQS